MLSNDGAKHGYEFWLWSKACLTIVRPLPTMLEMVTPVKKHGYPWLYNKNHGWNSSLVNLVKPLWPWSKAWLTMII